MQHVQERDRKLTMGTDKSRSRSSPDKSRSRSRSVGGNRKLTTHAASRSRNEE